jgi:hypothetical protein
MKVYSAAIGVPVLCALVFCAFLAPSASAETTTAAKCASVGSGAKLKDEHCMESVGGGGKGFLITPIAEKTAIETVSSNQKTESMTGASTDVVMVIRIKLTRGDIVCKKWDLTGTVKNEIEKGGKAKLVTGEKLTSAFSECTMKSELGETEGCEIEKGKIEGTNVASSTQIKKKETVFNGEGGKALWTIKIIKCKKAEFNKDWEMTGGLYGTPSPTTVMDFPEIGSTLKLAGEPASLAGKLTLREKGGAPIVHETVP